MSREAGPRKIVYLELVAPLLDDPASRSKWLFWLNRDLPWASQEGWTAEYWGLRSSGDRATSWGYLRVRGPKIPFRRVPWLIITTLMWSAHFFMALFGRRPGILLARSPYMGFGAALARVFRPRSLPLVVRIVERMPSTVRRVYGAGFIARLLEAIERFVLRRASLVVPIAGFTKEVAVRARVPEERILELPNPPRWGAVEAPLNTSDPEQPRLITAARLNSGKGIDVLLRAFAVVKDEFPRARLDIAGEGKVRAMLEGLARELGIQDRVRFLGWVPAQNMPLQFAGCLIAVLPSRVEEGHPMALREAALSGCALIGSDLGGIRDIVKPGKTGILVPPDDPSALARALRDCLLHPDRTRRFGEAARAQALAYFEGRERALAELRMRLYKFLDGPDRPGVPG